MRRQLSVRLVTLGLSLCFFAQAQSIVIFAGSPTDTGYSPSVSYTIPQFVPLPALPPGTQSYLRYASAFSYNFQVPVAGMYVLLLGFVEPCDTFPCGGWNTLNGVGQRIFSVWANDQPILQNIDVFAEVGTMKPLIKDTILYIPGNLTLSFIASVRNAMVSVITLVPIGINDLI